MAIYAIILHERGCVYIASYEYNKKYAEKYIGKLDELKVRLPGGRKQAVEARAKSCGQSVNGYINGLIRADMGLSEQEWKEREEEQHGSSNL